MKNKNYTNCPTCGSAIPDDAPKGLCPTCVLEGAATVRNSSSTGWGKTAPPSVAEIAPHFPDLEIIELLGAGGMGAVYKARQPHLDRTVAIKILSEELAKDPTFAERFNREAVVLARLSHPNIVTVFDFGTAGPYCYLLMEFVDGVNLRQAMRTGGFTPTEALALVQEICSALKFAHDEGILHRDIKPENVLIDSKGRVKIADFGIAKLIGEVGPENVTLTLHGSILGSPHYMAPEQFETPEDVDQRADIYSLGVVLYEMLTGELPIGRFAMPSEKAAMDTRIDEIVLRTLEKERQARFQSADEVMTEVETVAQSPGSPPPVTASAKKDEGPARFSLTAAVLTGFSLLLGGVTLYLANTLHDPDVRTIAIVIGLIFAGGAAILGFIFGARALAEIRRSGGENGGLGSAVFGVVVWPILFLGVVGTFFLRYSMSGGGGSIGTFGAMLFIGIPQILAAFVLVRGLRRWAGGVPLGGGGKRHPGLGRSMLVVCGLIFLGPVLATVASRFLPANNDPDHVAGMMKIDEGRFGATLAATTTLSGEIVWYRGAPEVVMPFEVHPGLQAELRIVRYHGNGIPEYAQVGIVDRVPKGSPAKAHVNIGTSGLKGDGLEGKRGFTAMLLYGQDTAVTIEGESDFVGWSFSSNEYGTVVFDEPGRFTFPIATRSEAEHLFESVLNLEVIVSEESEAELSPTWK